MLGVRSSDALVPLSTASAATGAYCNAFDRDGVVLLRFLRGLTYIDPQAPPMCAFNQVPPLTAECGIVRHGVLRCQMSLACLWPWFQRRDIGLSWLLAAPRSALESVCRDAEMTVRQRHAFIAAFPQQFQEVVGPPDSGNAWDWGTVHSRAARVATSAAAVSTVAPALVAPEGGGASPAFVFCRPSTTEVATDDLWGGCPILEGRAEATATSEGGVGGSSGVVTRRHLVCARCHPVLHARCAQTWHAPAAHAPFVAARPSSSASRISSRSKSMAPPNSPPRPKGRVLVTGASEISFATAAAAASLDVASFRFAQRLRAPPPITVRFRAAAMCALAVNAAAPVKVAVRSSPSPAVSPQPSALKPPDSLPQPSPVLTLSPPVTDGTEGAVVVGPGSARGGALGDGDDELAAFRRTVRPLDPSHAAAVRFPPHVVEAALVSLLGAAAADPPATPDAAEATPRSDAVTPHSVANGSEGSATRLPFEMDRFRFATLGVRSGSDAVSANTVWSACVDVPPSRRGSARRLDSRRSTGGLGGSFRSLRGSQGSSSGPVPHPPSPRNRSAPKPTQGAELSSAVASGISAALDPAAFTRRVFARHASRIPWLVLEAELAAERPTAATRALLRICAERRLVLLSYADVCRAFADDPVRLLVTFWSEVIGTIAKAVSDAHEAAAAIAAGGASSTTAVVVVAGDARARRRELRPTNLLSAGFGGGANTAASNTPLGTSGGGGLGESSNFGASEYHSTSIALLRTASARSARSARSGRSSRSSDAGRESVGVFGASTVSLAADTQLAAAPPAVFVAVPPSAAAASKRIRRAVPPSPATPASRVAPSPKVQRPRAVRPDASRAVTMTSPTRATL